jgi:GNAT superfamily N-acetyltransferase
MTHQLVEQLTSADEAAAVASLAAAFADYPLFPPLCPDPVRRPRIVESLCRYLFRTAVDKAGAYGTPDRSAILCTWPAGSEWPGLWQSIRCGGLGLAWRCGWRATRLLMRLEAGFDAARRRHVPGRHCYVPLLGVRPQAQGRGFSRALLETLFAVTDRQKVPVYLETMKEVNVAIYQRLGFELVGTSTLAAGLPNWELRRLPQ